MLTILIDITLQVSIYNVFHLFNWFFDRIEDIEKKLKKNKQEKIKFFQALAVTKKNLWYIIRKHLIFIITFSIL